MCCLSFCLQAKADYKYIEAINTQEDAIVDFKALNGNFWLHQVLPKGKKMTGEITIDDLPNPNLMLFDAIIQDSLLAAKKALNFGADVNMPIHGKLPLYWAITLKKTPVATFLMEHGASPA